MGNGGIIVGLMMISLFLSSTLISYAAIEFEGLEISNSVTLPSSYQESNIYLSTSQNFKDTSYNENIFEKFGRWDLENNVGYVLKSVDWLSAPIGFTGYGGIFIPKIMPDASDNIRCIYKINNSVKQDYQIILRYSQSSTQRADNNILRIENDGFHVESSEQYLFNPDTWGMDAAFISRPNANQEEYVTLETLFNDETSDLHFTFNGENYYMTNLNQKQFTEGKITYPNYIGLATKGIGFTVEEMYSPNVISSSIFKESVVETTIDFWNFLNAIKDVLTFNLPDEILDKRIQWVIIGIQEFLLLLGIVMFARGD